MRGVLFLFPLLAACDPDEEAQSIIEGTIQIEGESLSGQVATWSSFAYNTDGKAIVYFTSTSDASCDDVSTYLRGDAADFDPTPLFQPGYCNLSLVADYDGQEITWDESTYDAIWSLNCVLGDGEFVWEQRDWNDWDYYWSDRYWQGSPTTFSVTLSGGDGQPITVDAEMSEYDGGFIYEEMSEVLASGVVSGVTDATWCQGLMDAMIF